MPDYEYPRPALTVDVALLAGPAHAPLILLIERGAEPYRGMRALPGGFVDEGERPQDAARRELAEETGVEWNGPHVQAGAFADPGRDPRGWTAAIAWVAYAGIDPLPVRAGDDAADAAWVPIGEIGDLAFDHNEIVTAAVEFARLRGLLGR